MSQMSNKYLKRHSESTEPVRVNSKRQNIVDQIEEMSQPKKNVVPTDSNSTKLPLKYKKNSKSSTT